MTITGIPLRFVAAIFALAFLLPPTVRAQESQVVRVTAPFAWPTSEAAAVAANESAKRTVAEFFHQVITHKRAYFEPPGTPAIKVYDFRFVQLERGKFYLVLAAGTRWNQMYVLLPWQGGVRLTDMQTIVSGHLPIALATPDLRGNGIHELITAEVPTGYPSASTAPIYWYRVWQFRDGVPLDASSQFPDFYREFVLREIAYPERLLNRLQAHGLQGYKVPLAEIAYVRLKYERIVLGQPNAGLDEALAWAESRNTDLFDLGVFSLADMPTPAAGKELEKLEKVPVNRDLLRVLLDRRARLLVHTAPTQ
ncbi:MAG: hypothetical protein ACRD11_13685 [Terriglobia bacterium]